MRNTTLSLLFVVFACAGLSGQTRGNVAVDREPDTWNDPRLNTAAKATWMKPEEREMVYEINRLRSNPQRYIKYILPYLEEARSDLERQGKGTMSYSITTYYHTDANGVETVSVDTTWHDRFEEEVLAIEDLIATLKTLKPLSILQPDHGVYKAAAAHAADQSRHNWELGHRGSDNSWPSERILKYAPHMASGNENIAGKGLGRQELKPTPREIVIQLLIDSGIPGYGHRENILNPAWTHVAPYYGGWYSSMHQWLQEFARRKN